MLRRNPPQSGDAILINLMREVGLHPEQKFDWDAVDPAVRNGLTRAAQDAHAIVTARTKSFARKVNGWVEVIMDADMSDQPVDHIEDPDVMKKILKHLGLWDVKRKPRPVANAPPIDVFPAYDEQPGPSSDDYIRDPEYPADLSRRSSTCWVVAESEA
jgi:hypothetical protein